MLKVNFLPDSDRKDLREKISKGVEEYTSIWGKWGEQIVVAIERVGGMSFTENEINAIVYVSSLNSRSFPLSLKADLETEVKKGLLIHELCHRLLSGNRIMIKYDNYRDVSLEIHKVLDLILYDIWIDVYDEEFADMMVDWESRSRSGVYKNAWKWALSFKKEERISKFKELTNKKL